MMRHLLMGLVCLTALIPSTGQTWGVVVVSGGAVAVAGDLCSGGTATADSTLLTYAAANAFDNSAGTFWVSADAGYPHWIRYQFSTGYVIVKATIQSASDGVGHYELNAFKVQGSNNGTDWTDLYTGNMSDAGTVQTFTWSNTTSYTYARIYGTSTFSSTYPNFMGICEIQFMDSL